MKLVMAALTAFASILLSLGFAQAQDSPRVTAQGLYDAQCRAILANDVHAFEAQIAPDFTGTDPAGDVLDKTKVVASFQQGQSQLTQTGCTTALGSVTPSGSNIIVTNTQTITGTATTPNGVEPVSIVGTSTDSWRPSGNTYVMFHAALTELTVTLAGSVVEHLGGLPDSPAPSSTP